MRYKVKVKPNAKKSAIETASDGILVARVQAPPVDGKANEALVDLFAKHFKVKKSQIRIVSGQSSKNKVVEIVE